ncbi:unnamed protein product [Rhizoctonia solani]|uniref:Uncharacterized protein n=1 Tax=Rhizoctonia solani TaxID=456999 RepID=A0A8H2WY34_9AGAM|nr:unnamed protein product [Rhizoctonia solani]
MTITAGSGVLNPLLMLNSGGQDFYGMSLLGYQLTIDASFVLCRRTSFRNWNMIVKFTYTESWTDFGGGVCTMSSHVPLDGDREHARKQGLVTTFIPSTGKIFWSNAISEVADGVKKRNQGSHPSLSLCLCQIQTSDEARDHRALPSTHCNSHMAQEGSRAERQPHARHPRNHNHPSVSRQLTCGSSWTSFASVIRIEPYPQSLRSAFPARVYRSPSGQASALAWVVLQTPRGVVPAYRLQLGGQKMDFPHAGVVRETRSERVTEIDGRSRSGDIRRTTGFTHSRSHSRSMFQGRKGITRTYTYTARA